MATLSSGLLDSPRSDQSDSDCEARTTMLLSRVRLEHDPGASYGKFSGLDSPEASSYIPKIPISGVESKRYSLNSQSSDSLTFSPPSDWKLPSTALPSYQIAQPRSLSSLYAVNVATDSPVGSPEQSFDLSQKWPRESPQEPSSSGSKIYKPISMWSTVSPSSVSVSSSENTQTLSWARTPFKAPQLPNSQQENRSPNAFTSGSALKDASSTYLTSGRGQMIFSPASASSSPFSVTTPQEMPFKHVVPLSQEYLSPVHEQRSVGINVGCLVDLSGDYAQVVTPSSDETTKTIRLELQREMESLGTAMVREHKGSELPLHAGSSDSDVVHSDQVQHGDLVSGLVVVGESLSPARSVTSTSGETTELLFPHGVDSVEQSVVEEGAEETWYDVNVAEATLRFMCDIGMSCTPWLSGIRALHSFDSLCTILVQIRKVQADQLHVLESSLVRLLERGDVEAVDIQDTDDNGEANVTRLFRASLDCYARLHTPSS